MLPFKQGIRLDRILSTSLCNWFMGELVKTYVLNCPTVASTLAVDVCFRKYSTLLINRCTFMFKYAENALESFIIVLNSKTNLVQNARLTFGGHVTSCNRTESIKLLMLQIVKRTHLCTCCISYPVIKK